MQQPSVRLRGQESSKASLLFLQGALLLAQVPEAALEAPQDGVQAASKHAFRNVYHIKLMSQKPESSVINRVTQDLVSLSLALVNLDGSSHEPSLDKVWNAFSAAAWLDRFCWQMTGSIGAGASCLSKGSSMIRKGPCYYLFTWLGFPVCKRHWVYC